MEDTENTVRGVKLKRDIQPDSGVFSDNNLKLAVSC